MADVDRPPSAFESPEDPAQLSPDVDDWLLLQIIRQARVTLWAAADADENFAIRLWNPGAERIYGYSREEALGRNYLDLFVNPDEREKAVEDHERVMRHGEEFNWNFAAEDRTKDGTERTILGNCFRVWDQARGRYLIAELGIDLSDFQRSASEFRRVRELSMLQDQAVTRLRTFKALNAVNAAIAKLADHPDGRGLARVVHASAAAVSEMFTGSPRSRVWLVDDAETARLADGSDDLAGCRFAISPRAETLDGLPTLNERAVVDTVVREQQALFDVPMESSPLDACERDQQSSFAAVPLLFGADTVGVLLVFFPAQRDLGDDDRLLLQHFGTQVAVAIRMAKLAGEMQRRRREDTERARLAITESILHTVGNESGRVKLAVDSLSSALAHTELNGQVAESLDLIKSVAGRLGQIMGELMRLGEQAHKPVRLRLAEAVRIVTRPVERDHYKTIQIEHVVGPDLCVQASEYLFRESLGNLVSNAVQAMIEADGGGDLRISAVPIERDAGPQIQIDIEDSGPGVSPHLQTAIWDYGFTTRGEGHGHGLAHTRGLVSMLRGSVHLEERQSRLGGAHFRLLLPMSPPHTHRPGDPPDH
jgi:PAS domain S-box-containing protein